MTMIRRLSKGGGRVGSSSSSKTATLLRALAFSLGSGASCQAWPGEKLFNKLLCSTRNTQFCTSSIYPAEDWIRENNCNEAGLSSEQSNELLAVVDLFFSTGNTEVEGILREKNWLEGCNPCLYEGVFCDYFNNVVSINLPTLGLTGTIPSTMGHLNNLEFLQLEENYLHGTIPSELGSLATLNELKLHQNDLTGIMPQEVCQLKGWNGLFTYITSDCGGREPDVDCHFPDCCSECHFT